MSDLYLHLRRRLEEVTNWVYPGTEVMKSARLAKGLSYEGAARLTSVSSKTYERREKAGKWPKYEIRQLAEALGLEIDEPARERLTLPGDPGTLDRIAALLEEAAALIRPATDEQPPAPARSKRARK